MEIILVKDVSNLGYANEVVNVKPGYARNFLIPQGFAISATPSNKKVLEENKKQKAFKEQKQINLANDRAAVLNGLALTIGAKASENGKIYGSVNDIQLAEAIKAQHNQEVDRKSITILGDTVKELGSYKAVIKIYKDIKAEISFEVIAE
jgi:large subunit ribosomal protein L9